MKACLVFEDGRVFFGSSFGYSGESEGEVVFNTAMTGYQEILTDPSYKDQIVTMTYPLIGNYGVNFEDLESKKIHLSGFIVKEASPVYSNFRAKVGLSAYLKKNKVVGIEGVDTRAITRHIRSLGALKAIISTNTKDIKRLVKKVNQWPGLVGRDLVKSVTCEKIYYWNKKGKYKIVLIDCGAKHNIMRELANRGGKVIVVPANTTADKILAMKPDGVMLSNGPGDPEAVTYVIETVRSLLGNVPIFGICLGHQMLGLALNAKTYKLKFGHHGANQPVKDLKTGKVEITSQNHGFCVDLNSLDPNIVESTHINLNDHTSEGMRHIKHLAFSVQYHPEANPGPNDSKYLFDRFFDSIKEHKNA